MTTRTRSKAVRPSRLQWLLGTEILPVVAAAVLATLVAFGLLGDVARIEEISLTNPTGYDLAVQVRGDDDTWMPMSTARGQATTTVRDVIDQGDSWTFRFTAQGRPAGELHLTRAALERSGWAIEIPTDVEARLRQAGAPAPP
jgi:hypothetical protein